MSKSVSVLVLMICTLFCAGCGKSGGLGGLVPAKGVLKFNGQPVEGASVTFHPTGQTRSASAITDAKGNFTAMTLNLNDGIYPGEYIVTVTKIEQRGEIREEHPEGSRQPVIHDTREVIEHLPPEYGGKNTTGLKILIPESGEKNIEFNLTGDVDRTPKKVKDLQRR
ncbi:MAG: carboxypeptidase-like regulatory domain-containing protein [Planctomycetaceae bacterium]|jgi:hypothetical protein|nr:carboxypeptidase-like regulatory domain-containing protein [Planctomycetaceae bacterium]